MTFHFAWSGSFPVLTPTSFSGSHFVLPPSRALRKVRTETAAMGRSKNLILVFLAIVLTAVLLRRLLGVYGLVVPLLYMFFDVNWSLRVTWIVLKKVVFSRGSNHSFLDVSESTFIVLPSDMDLNLHMNNARWVLAIKMSWLWGKRRGKLLLKLSLMNK